jgi:membrane dipeptidase
VDYGCFDFGLSPAQEEHARRLHGSSIVIDLHWQGPCSPDSWTPELEAELEEALGGRTDMDFTYRFLARKAILGQLPAYHEGYVAAGVTTGITECVLSGERQLLRDAYLASQLTNSFDWTRRARSAEDIRAAKRAGGVALWGVCAFNQTRPGQLELVDIAHELGMLDICELAYNRLTFIAAGCTERYDPGLSTFGLEFVRRCNQVGVIVDTAHTGKQSTLDACRASSQPVIASHSSAEELYRSDRAKSDDELRAIAATGGVIGIYAIPKFLADPGAGLQTIELMLDHLDYVVDLVGWQHVAVGTDWPLALPPKLLGPLLTASSLANGFQPQHNVGTTATLAGFRDPRDWPNITRGLVARGYTDRQIAAIVGENFLRVFAEVCG